MRLLIPSLSALAVTVSHAADFAKGEPKHLEPKALHVPEGYEVTVWAKTPDLYNPTNMDVDQHGRIWVAEGVNYRWKRPRKEGDRIMVLEDTDKDGKADKSHVFWQSPEVACPLGVAVFDNKVVISQAPNLIVITDVDRNLKYDPAIDKKEVLLTGFNAAQHDHSLHSVTSGPDGKWYFNNGNCGAIFTDKSGKTFRLGGPYYKNGGGQWPVDTLAAAGDKSDDGHVYIPGFSVRMNPDGTDVEIIGQGYRNSYENINDSQGHLFQNDNDDPPACRNTYVMEYGSAGYFTEDGKRFYHNEGRPEATHAQNHWRQLDPDTMDAGDVYGGGSPTGVAFYENGAMGPEFEGTYLSCEPGKNVVFSYQPKAKGATFEMKRHDLITSNLDGDYAGADFSRVKRDLGADGKNKELKKENKIDAATSDVDVRLFRPSDVTVGVDGAIYICDWFDGRVGGHSTLDETCSGAIYRIAPKGFKPSTPQFDLTTIDGAITALSSPANNVRWLGFHALKSKGSEALPAVKELANNPSKWLAARAIWLLPHLGEAGRSEAKMLLKSDNAETRLVAYRALRRVGDDILPYAQQMMQDSSAAVRRDVALSLRNSGPEAVPVLLQLAQTVDLGDKNAVLAIRIGATRKREQLWRKLVEAEKSTPLKWSPRLVRFAWSLNPPAAVPGLVQRAKSADLSESDRFFALESLSFVHDTNAAKAMFQLCREDGPLQEKANFWFVRRAFGSWEHLNLQNELTELGLYDPKSANPTPASLPEPPTEKKFTAAEVLQLNGDPAKGKTTALRCIMCHEIEGQGVAYGPNLKGWGSRQSDEAIINSIIDPSKDIAHGFSGHRILLKDGGEIHGKIERWGTPTIVVSMGGLKQIMPPSKIQQTKQLKRSLMLSADQLGLSAQDVADLTAYLKSWK